MKRNIAWLLAKSEKTTIHETIMQHHRTLNRLCFVHTVLVHLSASRCHLYFSEFFVRLFVTNKYTHYTTRLVTLNQPNGIKTQTMCRHTETYNTHTHTHAFTLNIRAKRFVNWMWIGYKDTLDGTFQFIWATHKGVEQRINRSMSV